MIYIFVDATVALVPFANCDVDVVEHGVLAIVVIDVVGLDVVGVALPLLLWLLWLLR